MANYLKCEVIELHGCDHMLEKIPKGLSPIYLAITNIFDGLKDSWLFLGKKKEK